MIKPSSFLKVEYSVEILLFVSSGNFNVKVITSRCWGADILFVFFGNGKPASQSFIVIFIRGERKPVAFLLLRSLILAEEKQGDEGCKM